MNLVKKRLLMAGLLFTVSLGILLGQGPVEVSFQGLLEDIEGNGIGNERFSLTILLLPQTGQEALYRITSEKVTDEAGWFGFTLNDIAAILPEIRNPEKSMVIRLEFYPVENTEWIREGEDFMVSYTLKSTGVSSAPYTLTRMEGSRLVAHAEEHLMAFKDVDPFGYLIGGFLVTDQPPVSAQFIADLKDWLTPDPSEELEDSRGVKGAFPVGGYHKKN
jgi:hypothetical protein